MAGRMALVTKTGLACLKGLMHKVSVWPTLHPGDVARQPKRGGESGSEERHRWRTYLEDLLVTRSAPEACCAVCRCLDKAATRRGAKQPGRGEKWLYTVTQVEEVKRMLGFLPIMVATIVFNTGEPQQTVHLSLTATYTHRAHSQTASCSPRLPSTQTTHHGQ